MVGIYKFTNRETGESYIGKSTNIEKRYNAHRTRTCKSENTYFHRKIQEYGFDAFDFEILEECKPEELDDKEIYYIKEYNTLFPNGYNKEEGGVHAPHSLKITWDDVYKIHQDLKENILYSSEIAKKYGLSTSEISMINRGQIWIVDGEKYPLRSPKPLPKKDCPVCIICGTPITLYSHTKYCRKCYNEQLIRFIPNKEDLIRLLKTHKQIAIGEIYGVSRHTVMAWRKRYGLNRKGEETTKE